jgi:hypothetical protein
MYVCTAVLNFASHACGVSTFRNFVFFCRNFECCYQLLGNTWIHMYVCMYVCMYVYMYICKNLECNTNETNVSRYEDTESFSQFYSGFLKRLVLAYFHILSSGKQLGCIRRQKI